MTADTPEREQRASNDVRMREEAERVYDVALMAEATANGATSEGFARRSAINAMLTFRNQNYPAFADTELSRSPEEIWSLRQALIACGRHAGAFLAEDVSTDFLMNVPEEVRLKLASDRRAQGDGDHVGDVNDMVLVPREPTEAMISAGKCAQDAGGVTYVEDVWSAMLAAVDTPALVGGGG